MTTRILVASSRLPEVAMICGNMPRFAAVRTLVLAALFVIGLAATTPLPALAANSGTWAKTGSMATPRFAQGAALLQNGQALVAGGLNATDGTLASAELYDRSAGTWKETGSMNYARSTRATLLPSGQVLMAGGALSGNTAELYSNGSWTLTSTMKFSHPGTYDALLTNGDVLVFGGNLSSYVSEFYNPSSGAWTATHNIGVNPPNGPLTLLRTVEVLLAGGESGYGTDALCRLYDSPTNSWLLTGSMNQPRAVPTAP